jgi:hypothetical protein
LFEGFAVIGGEVILQGVEIACGTQWIIGGRYGVNFTAEGNLEVWDIRSHRLLWESSTRGKGATKLHMQPDGNLVMYTQSGESVWATGTQDNDGAFLALQGDGNVVIYGVDRTPLWWAAINRAPTRPPNLLVLSSPPKADRITLVS